MQYSRYSRTQTFIISLSQSSDLLAELQETLFQLRYIKTKSFFVNTASEDEFQLQKFASIVNNMPFGGNLAFEAFGGVTNQVGPTETAFVHRHHIRIF